MMRNIGAEQPTRAEHLCTRQNLPNSIKYEGHSISKLQNGAIPVILKIGKIQNMHFVGNLILNIHRIF